MEERYQSYKKNQLRLILHYAMLFLMAFAFISFAGCGSDSSTGSNNQNPNDPGEPTDQQGPNEVWIEGTTFNVADLEVSAGTTVTWENKSNVSHTVTSGTRGGDAAGDLFDSGSIASGETFSHTFEDAGSYDYFCDFHSGMSAEVTVTE